MNRRTYYRDLLLEMLMAGPITVDDWLEAAGVDNHTLFYRAKRDLLGQLVATDDTMTLRQERRPHARSLWHLTAKLDDIKPQMLERLNDAETRITTSHNTVRPLLPALDKRTSDGRRAQLIVKGTGRLLEDLEELTGLDTLWG